jgi:hydrogenase maturation protein HypF
MLPGGDASARWPVQAAAGFLTGLRHLADFTAPPFAFPLRYRQAERLIDSGVRLFRTSSAGRLFDTVAALLGFTRPVSFEGQAAMWLEHLAGADSGSDAYLMPYDRGEIDWRAALEQIVRARLAGEAPRHIARAFHRGLARSLAGAVGELGRARGLDTVVLSGGVFQNDLLVRDLAGLLAAAKYDVWINHSVPANDGGISLGQAAIAACAFRRLAI